MVVVVDGVWASDVNFLKHILRGGGVNGGIGILFNDIFSLLPVPLS